MLEEIKASIEPKITELGFRIDEVLYEKENNVNFLRVIIDCDRIITVDDCALVCENINPILDEIDKIDESYILDVCSKEKGCE
ncbi:MAG: hypothetical protein NC181_05040 [Clostridium sp.]|nr:hypothetical protein [Clostridium sp.]MCM1444618.1 hypothetical protein [Candidatus Amulumruptor caecigallinarius]